jgi:hypothetical protein
MRGVQTMPAFLQAVIIFRVPIEGEKGEEENGEARAKEHVEPFKFQKDIFKIQTPRKISIRENKIFQRLFPSQKGSTFLHIVTIR